MDYVQIISICSSILLIISEFLPFAPTASNGIIHFMFLLFGKKVKVDVDLQKGIAMEQIVH